VRDRFRPIEERGGRTVLDHPSRIHERHPRFGIARESISCVTTIVMPSRAKS
jgi:hypothetical protein